MCCGIVACGCLFIRLVVVGWFACGGLYIWLGVWVLLFGFSWLVIWVPSGDCVCDLVLLVACTLCGFWVSQWLLFCGFRWVFACFGGLWFIAWVLLWLCVYCY